MIEKFKNFKTKFKSTDKEMNNFKKYRRTEIAEIRPLTEEELEAGRLITTQKYGISISEADLNQGSPKKGDVVARNPKNHEDQWLIAKKYFQDNFELYEE